MPATAAAHLTAVAHEEPGWTLTPAVTIPVVLSLLLFVCGAGRLMRRSDHGAVGLRRRCAAFLLGWLIMSAAAVSPLHEAGESSFTLHMLEHELFMLAAAPLLVLARPLGIFLWAFPRRLRFALGSFSQRSVVRVVWSGASSAAGATMLQAAALWLWHAPSLFELALAHEGWHIAQHLSFIVSALLFWTAMLRHRQVASSAAIAAVCLFFTSVISGALGALMAFAGSAWYSRYAAMGLAPFGLTPLEDQQVAGLLMWIPGGLVHALAALWLIATAVAGNDRPLERRPSGIPALLTTSSSQD
jgi:cytochrome c oxidase assembly factor CtaG